MLSVELDFIQVLNETCGVNAHRVWVLLWGLNGLC